MDWADFYQKKYETAIQEKQELMFRITYYTTSLNRLKTMMEDGHIQASEHDMIRLRDIANTLERAEKDSDEYFSRLKEDAEKSKALGM